MSLLKIKNLHASVNGNEILRGVNLTVNPGEVHSIMGPNGSGKSTLAQVLARREAYDVTEGQIIYNGKDLLDMDPEERAREDRPQDGEAAPGGNCTQTISLHAAR